jgi:hypothetical protein
MFNPSMGNDCVQEFKCHVMICSSFVYLTKKCRCSMLNEIIFISKSCSVSKFGKVEITSTPTERSFFMALALLKL